MQEETLIIWCRQMIKNQNKCLSVMLLSTLLRCTANGCAALCAALQTPLTQLDDVGGASVCAAHLSWREHIIFTHVLENKAEAARVLCFST